MRALSPVCILAGGLGSRLGAAVAATPKPLLPVAGRPFLFHQLALLKRHGADRVVLSIGFLGEQIRSAVGDGASFGLDVQYCDDGPTPIGTAGAIRKAAPLLGDRFLVLYGDTYLRIDYADVDLKAAACGLPATMTVLRNQGLWDISNAEYAQGRVRYDKDAPDSAMDYIDYGLSVLTRRAMDLTDPEETDLASVFASLSVMGLLAGYEATKRFYHIGNPEALAETSSFLAGIESTRQQVEGDAKPESVDGQAC
jgi:N-acetyl-alpha-D-muramate 1-phosphate uridylyltransferase